MPGFAASSLRRLALRSGPLRPLLRGLYHLGRRLLRGYAAADEIPGRIHFNDELFDPESPAHYGRTGLAALGLIEEALAAAGRKASTVSTILDLGCGYGRVLRQLARRFPRSSITACDLRSECAAFCHDEFGARPLVAPADPAHLRPGTRYDLIWAGSVLTHLVPTRFIACLACLPRLLADEGLAVVTTHGRRSLELPEHYAVPLEPVAEVAAGLDERGVFFVPYPWERDYGITLVTKAFVASTAEAVSDGCLEVVLHRPRGWDEHQDVYAWRMRRREGMG